MPLVIVKLLEGRTVEQKRALVTAITDAVVEHIGAPVEHVDVIIEDHPRTNWAHAGTLYSDK
jgi:4-oxalocrotonate tautomerase